MATKSKANVEKHFMQAVIDSALDIVQVFKAERDDSGKIIDYTWFANNINAQAQNGNVIGKSLLQQNPGIFRAGIFDRMVQVTETGVAQRYEQSYSFEQFRTQWF